MPATLYSSTDLDKLQLSDVNVSSKGARSCGITTASQKPVVLRLPELRCPFGCTSWDDPTATRRNCDLTDAPPELLSWIQALDNWAIKIATRHSEKLFKTKKTEAEVRALYVSLLKEGKGDYAPTIRVKVNLAGTGCVRCWEKTAEGETKRRELPQLEEWRNAKLEAVCQLSAIWLQSRSFGISLTLTDAFLQETADAECPF